MAGHIEKFGDLLVLNINGDRLLAYPTQGEVWIISGTGDPGPGPGEPPAPGDGTFNWPFDLGTVSSEYGPRDGRVHQGIDLAPSAGTPIPAAYGGVAFANYFHGGFGNHLIIDHGLIGGLRIFTLYAHMENLSPFGEGSTINQGDIVGTVGNTGNSFGAHLHWETHINAPGGTPQWTNPGTHMNPRDFMAVYG